MTSSWLVRITFAALVVLSTHVAGRAEASPSEAEGAEKMRPVLRSRAPDIARAVKRSHFRIRFGDDPRWAQPDWNDNDWEKLDSMFDTPARRGVFWLRFQVQSLDPADRVPTGAWISALFPYELYWDGVLLVRNGQPGHNANEEISGRRDVMPRFPESLTGPGKHFVAMRISTYRGMFPGPNSGFVFFMNDPAVVQAWHMRNGILPTLAAGAMYILSIACFSLWFFAARRVSLLCFGVLTCCAATSQALTALRWFYDYPSDWGYTIAIVQLWLDGVTAWCFVSFVLSHFRIPSARIIALAFALALPVVYVLGTGQDGQQRAWGIIAAYAVAIAPLAWVARQRSPGAWILLAGVLVSAWWILMNPWQYIWTGFLPRFLPTLIAMILATGLQLRVERQEARQARMTAARLEIELLKKSLQPHFLMNTLTALAQTVEENPSSAVKLIDDLAEEFRTLAAISGETRVPLMRELALCHTHLRLMRARTDLNWKLETQIAAPDVAVPPAIFLTLIENGFSHQRTARDATTFRLLAQNVDDAVHYTFFSPGAITANTSRAAGGTGLRYVRARLEESFPGAWSLSQGAVAGGWETHIELRAPLVEGRS